MVTLGREMYRQMQVQLYLHLQTKRSCEVGRCDSYLVVLLKLLQMLLLHTADGLCFIGLIYSQEVSLLVCL